MNERNCAFMLYDRSLDEISNDESIIYLNRGNVAFFKSMLERQSILNEREEREDCKNEEI